MPAHQYAFVDAGVYMIENLALEDRRARSVTPMGRVHKASGARQPERGRQAPR
jgi:hypothetical protein